MERSWCFSAEFKIFLNRKKTPLDIPVNLLLLQAVGF